MILIQQALLDFINVAYFLLFTKLIIMSLGDILKITQKEYVSTESLLYWSIKRPVLSNVLVWNFLKCLYLRKIWSYCLIYVLAYCLSIKRPGLDLLKKSVLNDQYYLFQNSRNLERPGLIIETLCLSLKKKNWLTYILNYC